MRSSVTCAWTGSLVTIGGLGCAIWVFLRSLWLHIRIFWDRELGRKFKWGSILAGTILPVIFLIAVLTSTGFSYRMGQTCLPNSENAIVTFWVWLVIFAILGFVLQVVTTGYCVFVYLRSRHRDQRQARNSVQRSRAMADRRTWKTVKKLFLLQWRNILVSIFTILGSIAFFIVFFTQDSKLGRVFNDPKNIKPVKTWIVCQTLSRGDREECRRYVSGFTVPRTSVLASLILASVSLPDF
jgi:magnesium-transporting ATPase (P-type)